MPAGRPTKYKKKYCEEVIEHMKNGASFTSFAAKIGVPRETINRWEKKHEEFRLACKTAEEKSQQWWENFAMQSATGRLFDPVHKGKYDKHNAGMIQFIMKQRFYRDYNKAPVQEIKIEGDKGVEFKLSYDPKSVKDKDES